MKLFWEAGGFTARISETGSSKSARASRDRILNGNDWRELYRDALLESDPEKLGERVDAAQEAIRARVSLDGDLPSHERIAIEAALNALTMLKPEGRRAPQHSRENSTPQT
jgi:hypothetical protein